MSLSTVLIYSLNITFVIFIIVYLYFKHKFNFWKSENVPYLTPIFPFGNAKSFLILDKSFADSYKKIYEDLKKKTSKFGGIYMFSRPSLVIIDPDLTKSILIKDFHYFHDRGFFCDEEADPLGANLVSLKGNKWRKTRNKISPAFTSGKIKSMFNIMLTTSQELKQIIDKHILNNEAIDTKDIFARQAMDTIASCAFGVDCNSLQNPNTKFSYFGKKLFQIGIREVIVNNLALYYPFILRFFKISQNNPTCTKFFMDILRDTINFRKTERVERKDFLHLLIQLQNNQNISEDSTKCTNDAGITFNDVVANAFVFLVAGFETTSSTLNFCLFELTKNPDIQEKIRKEITETLKKYNGEITYDVIMKIKYMERVCQEVLRKYPSIPILQRVCTKDYKIPNSNYIIKKGTNIVIPTFGLQRDPQYYSNPEIFDPERFSKERVKNYPHVFLSFGDGPRICIGMKFALLQIKLILTVLLSSYKFTFDPKTITTIKFSIKSNLLCPKDTIWLQAEKIE